MKKLFLPLLFLFLAGCGQKDDTNWLGYAEGDNAFISAPQAGWITQLKVQRGSAVKPGDLLFTLDNTRQVAARDQARATLAQAQGVLAQEQANFDYTYKELLRQQGLARAHAGIGSQLDQAQSNYQQSLARLSQIQSQEKQAEASLADAQYQLDQRNVTSYVRGNVQDIYFRQGEYAPASTPVISVLPPQNVFVRFFVPETEFAKVKLGQKVQILCDSCAPNMIATISFIAQQEEFTPPVIFSVGNREKLVFKLEARAPGGLKLNPGQPIEVRPVAQ
ncbi:MAG TPA: HlyD family efflux transporter periplasmic adaptor subunit [Rhizomicrobium sp.]|nr:HlyD family efflux transporter periplasmic adaptor subunit [Rhizomicrobium sp.]